MTEPRETVTPQEASRITGQSISTLARYLRDGHVEGYTLPSGHRRYYADSVQAIIAPAGTPAPAPTS